jgi:uncharacterized protein
LTDLKESLLEDMKIFMKKGDKEKVSTIRMARASIKNVEIEKRKELDDEEVINVLTKEVKKIRDSIHDFEKVGKNNTVEKLKREIETLNNYLPAQLSKNEINKIIDSVIKKVDAKGISDMGKVMGEIIPEIRGRADGKEVNLIVQDRLKNL